MEQEFTRGKSAEWDGSWLAEIGRQLRDAGWVFLGVGVRSGIWRAFRPGKPRGLVVEALSASALLDLIAGGSPVGR